MYIYLQILKWNSNQFSTLDLLGFVTFLRFSWDCDLPRFSWVCDLLEIFLGLWPTWYVPGSVTYLRFSWVCWMGVFWSSVLESWSWNLMSCSLSVVSWSIHDNNFITTVYCHICIKYLIHVFYVLTKALPFVFVPHEAINC